MIRWVAPRPPLRTIIPRLFPVSGWRRNPACAGTDAGTDFAFVPSIMIDLQPSFHISARDDHFRQACRRQTGSRPAISFVYFSAAVLLALEESQLVKKSSSNVLALMEPRPSYHLDHHQLQGFLTPRGEDVVALPGEIT